MLPVITAIMSLVDFVRCGVYEDLVSLHCFWKIDNFRHYNTINYTQIIDYHFIEISVLPQTLHVLHVTYTWIVHYSLLNCSQWLQQLLGICQTIILCKELGNAFDCPLMQHLLCKAVTVIARQILIAILLQNRWIDNIFTLQLMCLPVLHFFWIFCEKNYIDKMLSVIEELFGFGLRRKGVG